MELAGMKRQISIFFGFYVKYPKDIPAVRSVCLKYFSQIPISFVVADICRSELLVEIEGQAELI